ncbi:MAG: ABC transporter permease [Candidatus Eisenbacteria bacterium]
MNRWREDAVLFVRAARARAWVRVIGVLREPHGMLMDAVFPNLGMCAYVLLYRALGAPAEFEALAVVGGILMTYWLNVLWGMGAQFFWEKQSGQLPLYFAAPCSRMAILVGMATGGLASTVLRSLVGVALAVFVFHVKFAPFSPVVFAAVFLATMAALYALGMIMASLFLLYGREAWHTCNALMEPTSFAAGLYFPVRTLGAFGALAASLVPLGLGVDAVRQVLLGPVAQPLLPVRTEFVLLCAYAAVALVVARYALRHLENLSKREGRLTQRWQ